MYRLSESTPLFVKSPWLRRPLTYLLYAILYSVWLSLSPLAILSSVAFDKWRGLPYPLLRGWLFFGLYLTIEVGGLAFIWPMFVVLDVLDYVYGESKKRREDAVYMAERIWGCCIFYGGKFIYGAHLEPIDGHELINARNKPALLLVRHTSSADISIPECLVSLSTHQRYVVKIEQLLDPILDLIGGRANHFFLNRTSKTPEEQKLEMLAMTDFISCNLDENSLVVLFPEGTRFSHEKQQAAFAKLRRAAQQQDVAQDKILEIHRELKHVLPPKSGGFLSLLEALPSDTDVYMCGHVGFEGATTFANFAQGTLIGAKIKVKFWKFEASSIPTDAEGRKLWLTEKWKVLDDWVEEQLSPRVE